MASESLRSKKVVSCGCKKKEGRVLHGLRKSPEYISWSGAKRRCCNPKNPAYANYGGRGITMCQRWLDSFTAFYEDMGPRPTEKHTLDRIDCNGPYSPENCRWATLTEQLNNKRTNRRVTYNGQTHTLAEWGRLTGIPSSAIRDRLDAGWDARRAMSARLRQH